MTTESKKLQTTYTGHGCVGNLTDAAVLHDLFIAHEQRDVIRKATEAMGAILQPGGCDWQAIREALAVAAPYILED